LKMCEPDVDTLMESISEPQFVEWQHFFELEPWGCEWENLMMARVSWATIQSQSKSKIKESDFLFKFEKAEPPTPEEYRAKAMRLYRGQGMITASPPIQPENAQASH
jgi:hypothetical protein